MPRQSLIAEHFNPVLLRRMRDLLARHRREHRQVVPQSTIDLADNDLRRCSSVLEFEVTFGRLKKGLPGWWRPVNQGTYMINYYPGIDRSAP
jgi:hypothetical protein